MTERDGIDDLDDSVEALAESLGAAAGMAAEFDNELSRIRVSLAGTGKDVAALEKGMSKGLSRAFEGVVFDGLKLSDALELVAKSLISTTFAAAIKPVTKQLGGLFAQGVSSLVEGILPFADGATFAQGRVTPFASGGVVSGPMTFPMRGGLGLMGEAGPEAIMPLARGADGKLGVRGGGNSTTVVMNITTPDVQGFQRSQGQIAAQMSRALGRGNRNR